MDTERNVHYHRDPDDNNWEKCTTQPCPNHHSNPAEHSFNNSRYTNVPTTPEPEPEPELRSVTPEPPHTITAPPSEDDEDEDEDSASEHSEHSEHEPIIPEPEPTMSADLAQALHALVQNQQGLQTALTSLLSQSGNAKGVAKPSNYDGKRGDDARRFLAAFNLYADNIPSLSDYKKRITSAISFLEGDAAIWATPFSEAIHASIAPNSIVAYPFVAWADFEAAFKNRFETTDATTDAKEMLRRLYQGKSTVGQYAATFKQYSTRTGYSEVDLRDRFYEHLADRIKDALVLTDKSTATLEELIKVSIDIDNRQIQREQEKHKSRTPFTPATARPPGPSTAPFASSARDPMAMDIDATRSADDYRRAMVGRCYGCGAKEHRKADGHHERDVCSHCGLVGHQVQVCRNKYLGRPAQAKCAAATTVAATAEAPAVTGDVAAMLTKLMADQKALADQISSLKSHF